MNTPVSPELAKLVRLKGFDWNSTKYHYTSAPTIAEVLMWLYEKHGIWIRVVDVTPFHALWEYQISKKDVGLIHSSGQYPAQYDYSPTEAYEKGIEYTLNNLI